jgi:sRNA-binding protein
MYNILKIIDESLDGNLCGVVQNKTKTKQNKQTSKGNKKSHQQQQQQQQQQ